MYTLYAFYIGAKLALLWRLKRLHYNLYGVFAR